jgi:hypothetical protein
LKKMRIILNKNEINFAEMIGKKRQEINVRRKLVDKRQDNQANSTDITIEGYAGQLAFCKLFNIYPDMTSEVRKGADPSQIRYQDWFVQVKTNDKSEMWVVEWRKPTDGLVFAKMKGTIVRGYDFEGFISSHKALDPDNLVEAPFGGKAYRIECENLIHDIPPRSDLLKQGHVI